MSTIYTQNLHFSGYCSSCGPTLISRQGMPGFAPGTWHCDLCLDCGTGVSPSVGIKCLDVFLADVRRLDAVLQNFFWECRMGHLSRHGWVRWLSESFGD